MVILINSKQLCGYLYKPAARSLTFNNCIEFTTCLVFNKSLYFSTCMFPAGIARIRPSSNITETASSNAVDSFHLDWSLLIARISTIAEYGYARGTPNVDL